MSTTDNPSSWRLRAGNIPYRLKEGGPVITATDEGTNATETYIIQASDVNSFYELSFPPPVFFVGRAVRNVRRAMPGAPFLVTKEVEFSPLLKDLPGDPLGVDDDAPNETYGDLYEARITYSTDASTGGEGDDPNPQFDEFMEHSFTAGAQILSLPAAKAEKDDGDVDGNTNGANPTIDAATPEIVEWNGEEVCIGADGMPSADLSGCPTPTAAGAKEDIKAKRLPIMWNIPTIEHTFRRKYVPSPNFAHLIALVGRVNSDQTTTLFNAKRETCLFAGVSGRQTYVWNGAVAAAQPWTIELKFTQVVKKDGGLTYGWNHVYDPDQGAWVRVYRPNGRPLYYTFQVQDVLNAIF